jgi:sensor domain CHASE-containing protein
MKLREKILLVSGLALTSCAYALYFASSRMFLNEFRELEEQAADRSARQALEALDERIGDLQVLAIDRAHRDDAVAFVENPGDAFKDSSLNAESLAALHLNLVAYIRPDGTTAYATGFDYMGRRFRPVPAGADTEILQAGGLLARCMGGEAVKGVVVLPEAPMILAAQSILSSAGNGPPRGMLVLGRFLEIREMTDLRRVSRQALNLFPLDGDPIISGELAASRIVDPVDPPVRVGTPGENVIAGYGIIRDVSGKPALTLRTVMPRDILNQGRSTVNVFLLALIGTGLVATFLVAWLFDRLVLSPLARLRADVAWTAARGSPSGRLPVTGNDDIAATAREVNRMLDTFEQSRPPPREHAPRREGEYFSSLRSP